MKPYNHKQIEGKWQKAWEKKALYRSKEGKGKKTYVLDMFPYPSGDGLHVGHPKGYIATDIYSRQARMSGKNVLHPMGWDAFGLPAENFAIKNKIHPRKAVEKNIKRFKEQLRMIGLDYDWKREINTTDPAYYKWTQWIFLQLLKKGLAYQSFEPINWCPSCQTGLANEDLDGLNCERCGTLVEKRPMRQWTLKITDYAERLLKDLDLLPEWQEHIKESQRNWIGKSEGAEIAFELTFADKKLNEHRGPDGEKAHITVFTTRADTLFGVTYMVLAPEHPWVMLALTHRGLLGNEEEVRAYIAAAKAKTEIERQENKEKTGVELEGVEAINPANGEKIPVFIADYVLAQYGTGAIMAVPAHDERDFAFAKKFGLPIRQVIAPIFDGHREDDTPRVGLPFTERSAIVAIVKHWKDDSILVLDWKGVAWHTLLTGGIETGQNAEEAALREILEETGYKNLRLIKRLPSYHSHFYHTPKQRNQFNHFQTLVFQLTDGEQVSVAADEHEKHTVRWVPTQEVLACLTARGQQFLFKQFLNAAPITDLGLLTQSQEFDGMTSEEARSKMTKKFGVAKTTYKLRDWVFSRQRYWGEPIPVIHCDACGVVPVPEKDLPVKLPEVKNYAPTGTGESPLAAIDKWVNVKCPKCKGKAKRETNTMPQWAGSSWYYLRYMDPSNKKALVDKKKEKYWAPVDMYVGGAEHATRHLIYARFWHKFLKDIKVVSTPEPFMRLISVGLIQAEDGRKMSKRFGNVINPDTIVKQFGADTLRVYEMFMGPFTDAIAWNTNSMVGSRRFIERVWKLQDQLVPRSPEEVERLLHHTIKKVTEDIAAFKFNTAISSMMIFVNAAEKQGLTLKQYAVLLQLLAPFAPHMTDELWSLLKQKGSIHVSSWPKYNPKLLVVDTATFMIQINGKVRGQITLTSDATEQQVVAAAHAQESIQTHLKGEIVKVVFVPGKLISFVVKS